MFKKNGGDSVWAGAMDMVKDARAKLTYFRIKELKDILAQLSLAKNGKKQDLVDRIAILLSDENVSNSHVSVNCGFIRIEEIVKIIDDTYRKIQCNGSTLLASGSITSLDLNLVKPKVEVDDVCQLGSKVRCTCGSSLVTDSMIKCEDSKCQVLQHLVCVMIPQKPLESSQHEFPRIFYCELCRLSRADPFCMTVRHPVLPLKLTSGHVADRTKVILEKAFTLSRADKELLQRTDYDLQVWCMLLNDEVYFRMHWPLHSELKVNGFEIRTTTRAGQQLLGINSRDDGQSLKTCAVEGVNKILLSGCDDRVFYCGVRIVRRQTVEQVLSMIPRESEGESLKDALARVHRCILGGKATENSDSDSDVEVIADSVTVCLRDPISRSRIRIAGRFNSCVHMGCFDLETYIIMNQRSLKWQCPTCLKNYSLENIIIDPYFNRITSLMLNCGDDLNEVEVRPDGTWRAKKKQGESDDNDLCCWHFPDGSLSAQTCGEDRRSPPSGDNVLQKSANDCQTTGGGSYRGREDASVNEGAVPFDFPSHEIDSISDNNIGQRISAPPRDADFIVISDSDEEDASIAGRQGIQNAAPTPGRTAASLSTGDPSLSGDLDLPNGGALTLGYFSFTNDWGSPLWEMQSYPSDLPSLHSDMYIPDAAVDAPDPVAVAAAAAAATDSLGSMSGFGDVEMNDQLAFCCDDDPSLQIFLPTQPDALTMHAGSREQSKPTSGVLEDDGISLTLAAGGVQFAAARERRPSPRNHFLPDEKWPESASSDSGSFLLSLNNQNGYRATANGRSPQHRFMRSRFMFSLDIDSDSQ